MTLINKAMIGIKIKKIIPYFVIGKLVIFTGFIIYMMLQ